MGEMKKIMLGGLRYDKSNISYKISKTDATSRKEEIQTFMQKPESWKSVSYIKITNNTNHDDELFIIMIGVQQSTTNKNSLIGRLRLCSLH